VKPLYWWPHFAPGGESDGTKITIYCYFCFWKWAWRIGMPMYIVPLPMPIVEEQRVVH